MKGQQRNSGHSEVQGIKAIGKQASCIGHHSVQDMAITSRLVAHSFVVWLLSIMRPSRVSAVGPALESTNSVGKQPAVWAKGPVLCVCSSLPPTAAMDTGKARLCTVAAGHPVWATWSPLKPGCALLPNPTGLNLLVLRVLIFLWSLLQTQTSLIGPHAQTVVFTHPPSTLLSPCSIYISKYFPISLTHIETWPIPKDVASPAALSGVSCHTSHSPCFSELWNAMFCAVLRHHPGCHVAGSFPLNMISTWTCRMHGGLAYWHDRTGDLNVFYKWMIKNFFWLLGIKYI